MSSKRMLADVLWEAANRWLSINQLDSADGYAYSCWAVDTAAEEVGAAPMRIMAFLEGLGCNTKTVHSFDAPSGPERQGARYMWLLLAMHVAEDEGIEV